MNTKTLVIGGLVIIIAGGAYGYLNTRASLPPMSGSEPTPTYVESMEKTDDATKKDGSMMASDSRYVDYSKAAFEAAKGKKRVLFFHAPWCPTCVPANKAFQEQAGSIPVDVVLFKTDYDSSDELKKQYGITYQHTYVLVDNTGRELKKWNGGALEELIANTK